MSRPHLKSFIAPLLIAVVFLVGSVLASSALEPSAGAQ